MALVIEDGTRVAGANSYVSWTDYTAWADARGIDITQHNQQSHIEQHILRAMDYFENLAFIGRKASQEQPLQWPRTEVVIDTYAIDAYTIPQQVKNAIFEITKSIDDGDFALDPSDRQTVSEKIGDIQVTYSAAAGMKKLTPAISTQLKKITIPMDQISRM